MAASRSLFAKLVHAWHAPLRSSATQLRAKASTTVRGMSDSTRRSPVDSSASPPTLGWNHVERWNHLLIKFNPITALDFRIDWWLESLPVTDPKSVYDSGGIEREFETEIPTIVDSPVPSRSGRDHAVDCGQLLTAGTCGRARAITSEVLSPAKSGRNPTRTGNPSDSPRVQSPRQT